MKKFAFSLARLQEFKNSLLDKEKLTLAALRAELARIEEEILRVTQQLSALEHTLRDTAAKGTTIFELKKLEYQIDASRRILKEMNQRRAQQMQKVDAQLQVVLGVKSEVSGLEKLRDKQQEEYDYLLKKESEEIIGELVSGQFIRGSSQ
ncbi:MAG: flagellar FliJ family protein [Oscillospiraceae bacterium]|nr:flagellar FliJ family protein [Oscillospiraceae bacterium]